MKSKKLDTPKNGKVTLRQLKRSERMVHQQEVDSIVRSTQTNRNERIIKYNTIKRMKWWSYLAALGIAAILTGLSFLVGYLAYDSPKAPHWQATGWTSLGCLMLLIVIFLALGWLKNNQATRYFNDKRKRYQHTLSDEEGMVIHVQKILFLAATLLLITVIVTNIVFK